MNLTSCTLASSIFERMSLTFQFEQLSMKLRYTNADFKISLYVYFAFLILRILELFNREGCKFYKK